MKILAHYDEIIHLDDSVEAVVKLIQEDNDNPEDFTYYEIDESTGFNVEMKAVRKEIPVRKAK